MPSGFRIALGSFNARRGPLFILLCLCFTTLLFLVYKTHVIDAQHASQIYSESDMQLESSSSSTSSGSTGILLVSALFPLSKSKHTMNDYRSWLKRFLGSITTDIYFFTTPELEELVRSLRGDLPITINSTYSSPFDIPPLKGLEGKYEEMHGMDREKKIHSAELYAVWNAKPFFLEEGLKNRNEEGREYEYGFWVDAGSFRGEHVYKAWPDRERIEEIFEGRDKEVVIFPMHDKPHGSMRAWREEMGPVDNEFSEGSFFGGAPQAIKWWREVYYRYHDQYLSRGLFVGKDQTLINALFLLFPEHFITVWLRDPEAPAHQGLLPVVDGGALGSCGPEWYYYEFWMADKTTRETMRSIWLREWRWDWWKERERCRVTRVMRMIDVLHRAFGEQWVSPARVIM